MTVDSDNEETCAVDHQQPTTIAELMEKKSARLISHMGYQTPPIIAQIEATTLHKTARAIESYQPPTLPNAQPAVEEAPEDEIGNT